MGPGRICGSRWFFLHLRDSRMFRRCIFIFLGYANPADKEHPIEPEGFERMDTLPCPAPPAITSPVTG